MQSLQPTGPYPILTFTGEQSTGKSMASRMVRALVGSSPVPLRVCPTNEHHLVITANNSWLLAFDNLDTLSTRMSDAFCRLSTGGSFATRRRIRSVRLDRLPRMAHFARWTVAAEPAFPVPEGTFLRAYQNHHRRSVEGVLDRDAVAGAIHALLGAEEAWTGTTKDLLIALKAHLPNPSWPPSDFPTSYQQMAAYLRRLMPILRELGIERVVVPRVRSRTFTLRWTDGATTT